MEKKTILIIDDDNRNIFALTAVLKSKGFRVISAASAKEGLQKVKENKGIGIVLMDIMMPEMDGHEAIAQIRGNEATAKLPVIAVTAQAMVGDREKALSSGADDYISKPINVDVLLELLAKY